MNSFMIKLLLSQFVNIVAMNYILSLISKALYWESGGLIMKISNLLFLSSVIKIIITLINGPWIKRKLMLLWNYRFTKRPLVHQDKLNKDYEAPGFDIASRYVNYILAIYNVCFYSYIIPYGSGIMLVVFLISYLVDKINLFCRSCLKD